MPEGKFIVASGPVIIENGKLLVNKDNKDDFYKLPGGTVELEDDLIKACHREVKEEINAKIKIIKPLNPMIIYKNPQTKKQQTIILIHYQAKLLNKNKIKPIKPIKEIACLEIKKIKQNKYRVAPNIKFLMKVGDIK